MSNKKSASAIFDLLHKCGDLSDTNVQLLNRYADRFSQSGFRAILSTNIFSDMRLADI